MPNGRKLLSELGQLEPKNHKNQNVYFRTHNLLTTGDGTPALKWGSTNAYTEDTDGNPVYDWTIIDQILSAGLENGVKPYVQLGFMPQCLSTNPEPYQHSWSPHNRYEEIYTGWAYPPKDYEKWAELVYQLTKHCVEKWGAEEVQQWYWEVWNEPNIGYWKGTDAEFYRLHDTAVGAVRRALPSAKVGGPEMADGTGDKGQLKRFFEHCVDEGVPLDFLSFHAKGKPELTEGEGGGGHVRMGISQQLQQIDAAFETIASFPELKEKPIVIGESDPDGCAACQGPHLDYRNGTMYAAYTAAAFARKHELAYRHKVNLEGALTWAYPCLMFSGCFL